MDGSLSLVSMVTQSDLMSKIILLLLMTLSTVCWASFFYYGSYSYFIKKTLAQIIKKLSGCTDIHTAIQISRADNTAFESYAQKATRLLMQWQDARTITAANENDWAAWYESLNRIREDFILTLRAGNNLFVAIVESAPLLGLFGTVWGLIHSFMRISQLQNADIVTVAPGIAEALITTLIGLVVALPALALFHTLQTQQRTAINLFDEYSDLLNHYARISNRDMLINENIASMSKDAYVQNTTHLNS